MKQNRSAPLENTIRFVVLLALVLVSSPRGAADAVTEWNEQALSCTVTAKQLPFAATRTMAMVHVAMFDAVNSIQRVYTPYKFNVAAGTDSSLEAAAIAAAHAVLIKLFPDQSAMLDAAYSASLVRIAHGTAKGAGVAVGEKVAADLLASRAIDGSEAANDYRPATTPGVYVVTTLPVASRWANVTPFFLERASQFRPGPPPSLTSPQWAHDYNEIKDLGAKKSSTRTPEQTEIARFWALTGPGAWDPIVRQLASSPGRTLPQNARLFALVEMAGADAYISVFDAKYAFNFWRPITAIRNGDLDGNDETARVADWEPLIDTPLHPEYSCAHCITSQAVATVLESEFGNAPVPQLSMTSSTSPGVTHKWSSIREWADEISCARVYAGLHYRNSTVVGQAMGKKIGELAVNSFLKPVRRSS